MAPLPGSRMQALTLLTLRACGLADRAGALLAAVLAPGSRAGRRGDPGGGHRGPAGGNRGGPSAEGIAGAGNSLIELDLAENALGACTAAALGAALERNHALRRLDLSSNRIDVRCALHAHTTCPFTEMMESDTHGAHCCGTGLQDLLSLSPFERACTSKSCVYNLLSLYFIQFAPVGQWRTRTRGWPGGQRDPGGPQPGVECAGRRRRGCACQHAAAGAASWGFFLRKGSERRRDAHAVPSKDIWKASARASGACACRAPAWLLLHCARAGIQTRAPSCMRTLSCRSWTSATAATARRRQRFAFRQPCMAQVAEK